MSTPASSAAVPLPTVPAPSAPAADSGPAPADSPAESGPDIEPAAGTDPDPASAGGFAVEHTGRAAPVVLFGLAAALSAVIGVLASPELVRVLAFGLAGLLCLAVGRVLTRAV